MEGDINMSKVLNIVAVMAALPILAIASSAYADAAPGQIEQGDIYRVEDITSGAAFADNINATCGDTVAYRVRIHNGGPATLTNVKVAATLDQSTASTSHGSVVSVTADNNLDGATVTANAGVTTAAATAATYISGSTELLNYSATPGDESVIANLPDGILGSGVNIGSVGPLTPDTEEVQFEAKLSCPAPATPAYACTALGITAEDNRTVKVSNFTTTATNGATFTNASIDWGDNSTATTTSTPVGQTHQYAANGTYTITATANFSVKGQNQSATSESCAQKVTFSSTTPPTVTPPTTTTTTPAPTTLVNTGAGNTIGLFAAVTAAGTVAYRYFLGRRLSRQ
jgi:uncharacterized repeat protein (TIGR01451 family)